MSTYQAWIDGQRAGAAMLLHVRRNHLDVTTVEQLAQVDPKTARALVHLASQFTLRHLEQASEHGLSINQLEHINRAVRQVRNPQSDLRKEFIDAAPQRLVRHLRDYLQQRVAELNEGELEHLPQKRFNLAKQPDAYGRCFFTGVMPQATAATIRRILHKDAIALRRSQQSLSYEDAFGEAFIQRLLGKHRAEHSLGPCFLWPLEHTSTYFADGTAVTTDGGKLRLQDLLNTKLADYGYAVLYGLDENGQPAPVSGAVVTRTEVDGSGRDPKRHFSPWQKFLACVDNLTCAYPGCERAAATCQGHHITAWNQGGRTEMSNLAPLCGPHNAQNDDDPEKPPVNGRIERDPETGFLGHRRHRSSPIITEPHPKSGASWIRSLLAATEKHGVHTSVP
ncbi:HNH endonuclease signature motif containing protein [Corynebacterium sp. HS2168-gen11]|uniref:HNH endonuclease signature motif containing protein n=1 Tax=Corynebacterium sp. HS2168-gen11 TaxID=2974027 RepID=UPI00216B59CD|nr:HNH endonuclease signature motif containing protein [Corynebacterium sp. HS2168-gen11]MCS4535520.1 HNH endonuclease [Corynebacterium sp. HS2168-gen11]